VLPCPNPQIKSRTRAALKPSESVRCFGRSASTYSRRLATVWSGASALLLALLLRGHQLGKSVSLIVSDLLMP
jgi:hypothetical protein